MSYIIKVVAILIMFSCASIHANDGVTKILYHGNIVVIYLDDEDTRDVIHKLNIGTVVTGFVASFYKSIPLAVISGIMLIGSSEINRYNHGRGVKIALRKRGMLFFNYEIQGQ